MRSITVLAGPASRAASPAWSRRSTSFIEFEFFHARSQLGERELTEDDFAGAAPRSCAPYRFDLAVDLRKHLSTRDVLQYTGARFLAGFDYMGQFPLLDIALDWDGDQTLAAQAQPHRRRPAGAGRCDRPRACDTDRTCCWPSPPRAGDRRRCRTRCGRLFARPVVAMHPGAGNITKQWPAEHFAALIDLLIDGKRRQRPAGRRTR